MRKIVCLLLIIVFACQSGENKCITNNDFISKDSIYKMSINRGVLLLNNSYFINCNSSLIQNRNIPDWLIEKNRKEYYIDDVKPPYYLYKEKRENYFYIIKNKDTLKFKLRD